MQIDSMLDSHYLQSHNASCFMSSQASLAWRVVRIAGLVAAHVGAQSTQRPASADYVVNGAGSPVGTPLSDPALIEMISEDPILRDTKLIAEAWDCDGLNQLGAFPHYNGRWAEWNGQFRDVVRQFMKVSCNTSVA